jgi:hypothetical protein
MAAQSLDTSNHTLSHLGDFLASGGHRTIGALVFWSLAGVRIERTALRAALGEAGLGAAMSRDPRHSASLTTAVHQVQVGKPNVLMRKVAKGWALVLESPDPAQPGKLTHVHAATVVADPMEIMVERRRERHPERPAPELDWKFQAPAEALALVMPLAREVEEKFAETRSYLNTSDLGAILVNAMHGTTRDQLLGAVSLRQTTGGLYFVHGSKLPVLHALRSVVERLAPKCEINVLTITGSSDNLQAAGKAARASFQLQLAELKKEVSEFRAGTPLAQRQERSVVTRADAYRQLSARVELFRDVLGGIADELGEEIEGARAEVERLLDAP